MNTRWSAAVVLIVSLVPSLAFAQGATRREEALATLEQFFDSFPNGVAASRFLNKLSREERGGILILARLLSERGKNEASVSRESCRETGPRCNQAFERCRQTTEVATRLQAALWAEDRAVFDRAVLDARDLLGPVSAIQSAP